MMHLIRHIFITAAAIFFHPCLVLVAIVHSLPPEPVVLCMHTLEVDGAMDKESICGCIVVI